MLSLERQDLNQISRGVGTESKCPATTGMDTDERLRELAATQHGVAAMRQAYDLGLTVAQVRHRLVRGDWVRLTPRVMALAGAPPTDFRPAMQAVLHHGPESYVSHVTALGLWGVPGFSPERIHVLSRRAHHRRSTPVGVVHSTTDLFDSQITSLHGVPIVTPIRAIFDIAGRTHPMRVERALDNAWARRLVTYALLHRTLGELADRGRPGIRRLRALAEERPPDYRPPDSNTENRFKEILERAGERPLRRQVNLGTQTDWVGRIDFVDDRRRLSVEIQSELFHGSVLDRRRDEERIFRLRASGQEVLEVWETTVWRNPDQVVREVRDARRRAAARLS
jgi:very-short-patch-repair endonuclease